MGDLPIVFKCLAKNDKEVSVVVIGCFARYSFVPYAALVLFLNQFNSTGNTCNQDTEISKVQTMVRN